MQTVFLTKHSPFASQTFVSVVIQDLKIACAFLGKVIEFKIAKTPIHSRLPINSFPNVFMIFPPVFPLTDMFPRDIKKQKMDR